MLSLPNPADDTGIRDESMLIPRATDEPLVRPWLIAAWPGMGGVASIAAGHLAQALDAKPLGMLPERDFFQTDHVDVRNGMARAGRLPRCLFFTWRDPKGERDLVFFIGEAQPQVHGDALCRRILDVAQANGVERIVTFAAMASAARPQDDPRVYAAVTAPAMLDEMRRHHLELLPEGQIGGLNGALLAASAERGMPAMCLLGEMPFFAAGAPNPKSALAALNAFTALASIDVDLKDLTAQADAMAPQLAAMHEQLRRQQQAMQRAVEQTTDAPEEADDETAADQWSREHDDEPTSAPEPKAKNPPTPKPRQPDQPRTPSVARRRIEPLDASGHALIESLFVAAERDRSHAVALKTELDRLGVFAAYEDRFLDLFRKAG